MDIKTGIVNELKAKYPLSEPDILGEQNKKEFVLSKQILRSGTSIGANIRESKNAESNSDYLHKLSIALKEADETQYWLEVLLLSNIITNSEFDSMNNDVKEIIALLTSIITKIKNKVNN